MRAFISRQSTLYLLSSIFAVAFIAITYLTLKGFFFSIDRYIYQTIPGEFSSSVYLISKFLAFLYILFIIVIVILFLKFVERKKLHDAKMLLATFSGAFVSEVILKPIFRVPCPVDYYIKVISGQEIFGLSSTLQYIGLLETCFPSTHVAGYVVFAGYLASYALKNIKRKWKRYLVFIALLAVIVLVGPSRIYLHAHWFSDVIAGYFLGFSLLLLLFALNKQKSTT